MFQEALERLYFRRTQAGQIPLEEAGEDEVELEEAPTAMPADAVELAHRPQP